MHAPPVDADPTRPRWSPSRKRALAGVLVLSCALAVAACGGGSPKASTTTTDPASSSGGSGSSGGSNSVLQQGLQYAQCMRSHGVTNYPDPSVSPNGDLQGSGPISGIDTNSPTYTAAAQACQKDAPSGFSGGAKSLPASAQTLKYAQCMRSHGVTNYPDAGEITRSMGIDPNSPTFQAASSACKSLLPVPGGANGG
jgi:hypothetical protein